MTKETYKDAVNKRLVRDKLFKQVKLKRVVGLGGPDINDYYQNMKNRGFNDIKSYEKDKLVFLYQLSQNPRIQLEFGNINEIKPDSNVFYDLDYCCTIMSVDTKFLNQIDNFIATFSVRGIGFDKTKKIINNKLKQTGYKYKVVTYTDSSPMLCLLKIKK